MRSRYVAFVRGDYAYIRGTMRGEALAQYQAGARESWGSKHQWVGLDILTTVAGGDQDEVGTVEFKAHFQRDGADSFLHEVSEFKKQDGRWFYFSGRAVSPDIKPVVSEKQQRNALCACGSGLKYKKCCGVESSER